MNPPTEHADVRAHHPRFEVADSPYGWLNRSLFAAELNLGGPNTAVLHVYEIT